MRSLGVAAAVLVVLTAAGLIIYAVTSPTPTIPQLAVVAPPVAPAPVPTPAPTPPPEPTPVAQPEPARVVQPAPTPAPAPKLAAVTPKPKPVEAPAKPVEPLPQPAKTEIATTPQADPNADAEQTVRNTIKLSMSAFEDCYQNSLRRDSRIKGRIVVSVGVDPNGRVVSAKVDETTIKDNGVVNCITARLKALRFPPLGEEVEVTVPLSLVPREG